MIITTKKKPWQFRNNSIIAFSDQGHRLEIPYPYHSDDSHWFVAIHMARALAPGSEVKIVGAASNGFFYQVEGSE